jgi:hypothetical protein
MVKSRTDSFIVTAGQERYRAITSAYVFSVTEKAWTLNGLIDIIAVLSVLYWSTILPSTPHTLMSHGG